MDADELRRLIRRKIITGELPGAPPVKTWAGMGNSRMCRACEEPIRTNETEVELQLPLGRPSVLLHRACHDIWRDLCAHG